MSAGKYLQSESYQGAQELDLQAIISSWTWMIGVEPVFFARIVYALSPWAISSPITTHITQEGN